MHTAYRVGKQVDKVDVGAEQVVEAVGEDDAGVVVGGDCRGLAAVDERPDAEHDHAEPALTGGVRLGHGLMPVDSRTACRHQQTGRLWCRRVHHLNIHHNNKSVSYQGHIIFIL